MKVIIKYWLDPSIISEKEQLLSSPLSSFSQVEHRHYYKIYKGKLIFLEIIFLKTLATAFSTQFFHTF